MKMSPKEILQKEFQHRITPWLDSIGFNYLKSKFSYKRKKDDFVQIISISLSYRNTQDSMRFWSSFNIESGYYKKWVKRSRKEVFAGYIGGCNDWNIPGWDKKNNIHSFDFRDPKTIKSSLNVWKDKCQNIGIPFLDQITSWEGAAEDLIRNKWHYDRAADFYIIAGKPQKALSALNIGVELLKQSKENIDPNWHPMMIQKKERLEIERQRQISNFQTRILKIEEEISEPSV